MKKLLILPLLLAFQIVSAQWNAIGWNPFTLRSTSGDSTFVLSAPSRVDLQKGTASWVPERQASYLVYTALLTQTGTNAPVATVLENTLGGTVTWSRVDAGSYAASFGGSPLVSGKTIPSNEMADLHPFSTDPAGNNIEGYYRYIRSGVGSVSLIVYNSTFSSVDISDYGISLLVEIKVYP